MDYREYFEKVLGVNATAGAPPVVTPTIAGQLAYNTPETGEEGSPDGSWQVYWEKHAQEPFGRCVVDGCGELAVHGAHVNIGWRQASPVNIVPMCATHNHPTQTGGMVLRGGIKAVSAPDSY